MTYIQPVLPAILLLFAAYWARPGRGRRLFVAGAVALFLWSWAPVSWLSSWTLERTYPVRPPAKGAPVIVILGEGVRSPTAPWDTAVLPSAITYLRCRYGAWLYRNGWEAPILLSGGGKPAVASVMKRVLEEDGIPAPSLWTEETSSNTYENARNVAALLAAKGIRRVTLVTDARHMRRAEACFRKQGLDTIPAPCGYRFLDANQEWLSLIPRADVILLNEDVLHEWVSLGWYRLTGKL